MSVTLESYGSLIKEFDEHLPKKPYFALSELIDIGLFGSSSAVNAAIKRKDIPSIKVSPKRTVVPRSAVVDYFRKNLANCE